MKLKAVLVHNPVKEFQVLTRYRLFGFKRPPNAMLASDQHNIFVETLASEGVKVYKVVKYLKTKPLLFQTRDLAFVYEKNALICNMSSSLRKGEELLIKEGLKQVGIKLKGHVFLPGSLEGSNIILLDKKTALVGYGIRANEMGVKKLKETFPELNIITVNTDLHLDHYLNIVDKTAVISESLAYTEIYEKLKELEYDFIIATKEETNEKAIGFIQIDNGKIINIRSSLNKKLKMRGYDIIQLDLPEFVNANAGCKCLCLPIDYSF
jgi:N-dimethylarginine dimethylaminohydrolase